MKTFQRVFFGFGFIALVSMLGFVVWAVNPADATDVALEALLSDSLVTITSQDGFITFEPAQMRASTGFLFYPGGRVDYRAYAPVLRRIAEQGYFVALVEVRLNLAYFDVNAGDKVLENYPGIEHWAVGGHSLGGVAAAAYATQHPDQVQAVVFWASYPADDSLSEANIPILSIYGSQDGLATEEDIKSAEPLLPAHTKYVAIEGGNHSQFGSYGFQNGDGAASISPEEQWDRIANATAMLLASLAR